jgi:hypothetical protein
MALCALASVLTWAAVFLLPVFVQSVQGRSALAAGLAMAPQGLITGLSTALTPRLQALTEPLRPEQLGDANTLFNTCQRIAGSFGIGLIAALYVTQARAHGPVSALHLTGVVLAALAGAGVLAALALPAVRNTALARD